MEKLVGQSFVFDVTEDDIDKGECISSVGCAIALAVNRELGQGKFEVGYKGAIVRPSCISFRNEIYDTYFSFIFFNDNSILKWLDNFEHKNVSSFSMKLSITDSVETQDIIYAKRYVFYKGDAEIIQR